MKTFKILLLFIAIGISAFANEVVLTWSDNSNNEDGFIIERALGSANAIPFAEIGRVATDITTFTDSTVARNTTYTYRVIAFNAGGKSQPSERATVKTIPNPPNPPNNTKANARSKD